MRELLLYLYWYFVWCAGFVRVLESFGKLWKLVMPFSRTWKVLEKDKFFKVAMESFWIFISQNFFKVC